jgi:NAD(P)-dependent dehydrogenase (short-subunit alcohol dehydrogenase family)
MAHISSLHAPQFVTTNSEEEIARRLREDEALINAGKPCSWIAWQLPEYGTKKGASIAAHLAPAPHMSHDIKSIIYENLLNRIRRHLKDGRNSRTTGGSIQGTTTNGFMLLPTELSTALKVLKTLQETAVIQQDTSADIIVSWLEQQLAPTVAPEDILDTSVGSNIPKPPSIPRKRLCYICRLAIVNSYPSHPSLCIPCGAFNHSSSRLSAPPRLSLPSNFTALVTGARINLGYHTALRLLRCGARVIATTRYPRDAVARYLNEQDAIEWRGRLRVVGADFRSAADAFALVHETKGCLDLWGKEEEVKLCALINNAAQTLTDSVRKEERAVAHEQTLSQRIESAGLLVDGDYKARVRGGALPITLEGARHTAMSAVGVDAKNELPNPGAALHVTGDAATTEVEPYFKSSWVQSMSEIPYEDVMSAHAVNAFVPLILIRELLALMGSTDRLLPETTTKPQGYIINVSSREGIFEDNIESGAKGGKHVHTNMSKAALNMITETEAATAWHSRRVAMNTVDPGYMSAAPEYEDAFDGVRPIGWEDGAGRVLWPLAVGELEGKVIRGRFLKHYGAVEVDPGAGRG